MNKKVLIGFVILSVSLFLTASTYFFLQATRNIALPVYGQVMDFRLKDVNGKELGLADLNHKVWVANFFFTTCSNICPMMTKNMAALHRSYKLVDDVAFVSVTVNPENDNTEALAQYAKKYEADTAKWHFLTGSREAITELMVKSFKLSSLKDPIFHSSSFVLVDRKGQIRGYYDGTSTEEVQQLSRNIAAVLKEKKR
jgi:protein SCO1/2